MNYTNNNNDTVNVTDAWSNNQIVFPDPALELAYIEIRRLIANGTYTSTNWLPAVIFLMKAAGNTTTLTGLQKKNSVLELSKRLLLEIPMSNTERQSLNALAGPIISEAIDAVYDASLGKFNFKNTLKDTLNALTIKYNNDAVFKQVYDEVKGAIVNKQFNASNFLSALPIVMAAIRRATTVPGPKKKELCMALMRRLASELPITDPTEKASLELLLEMTLPAAIDLVYDAASGKFDFGKMKAGCAKCFSCK